MLGIDTDNSARRATNVMAQKAEKVFIQRLCGRLKVT